MSRILTSFSPLRQSYRTFASTRVDIFDPVAKRAQRDRAFNVGDHEKYQFLRDEVAFRLSDRLLDIKRTFDVAVEIGADYSTLATHLSQDTVKTLHRSYESTVAFKNVVHSPDVPTQDILVQNERLPFQEKSTDLCLSNLHLHWVNDLPCLFAQVLNILKPDGCFIGVLFGIKTLWELRVSLQLSEIERLGGFAAHVSPFADNVDIGNLLHRAGFTLITMDVDELTVHYPTIFELMRDLRGMGESNCARSRPLTLNRDVLLAADSIYRQRFGRPSAEHQGEHFLPATFRLLYFIAWRPDPSQLKPIPRGSAKHSLKDIDRIDELLKSLENQPDSNDK